MRGVGRFNRLNRLVEFVEVEDVTPLDPLDVSARIDDLKLLRAAGSTAKVRLSMP